MDSWILGFCSDINYCGTSTGLVESPKDKIDLNLVDAPHIPSFSSYVGNPGFQLVDLAGKSETVFAIQETEKKKKKKKKQGLNNEKEQRSAQKGLSHPPPVRPAPVLEDELEKRVNDRIAEVEASLQEGASQPPPVRSAPFLEDVLEQRVSERVEEVEASSQERQPSYLETIRTSSADVFVRRRGFGHGGFGPLDEQELRDYFSFYGEIASLRIPDWYGTDCPVAFITFQEDMARKGALRDSFNGSIPYVVKQGQFKKMGGAEKTIPKRPCVFWRSGDCKRGHAYKFDHGGV